MGNQSSRSGVKYGKIPVFIEIPDANSNRLSVPSPYPHLNSFSTTSNTPSIQEHLLKHTDVDDNINGVTDVYLSITMAEIATNFWKENVAALPMEQQLEIGCSIYFGMASTNKDFKKILKSKWNKKIKIEQLSLKLLDMISYLIGCLLINDIDLYSALLTLGELHKNMGIKLEDYTTMILSMHETFSYYFNQQYTIQVKHAIDEVFNIAVKIMDHQY